MTGEIVILDPTLAEFAGVPAWEGTAWKHSTDPDAHLQDWQVEQEAGRRTAIFDAYVQALPKRYQAYNLDSLRVHAGNELAVQEAAALQVGENLFLHGPAGNGKTHLAVATGRRFAEAGRSAQFYGVVDLFNRIRNSFNGGPERPDLTRPDVLVLDDLGKIKPTEFVYQEFYAALEARWSNEKTTIFTANHGPKDAAKALGADGEGTAAILSRLASGRVAAVAGKDLRLLGGRAA